MKTPLAAPFGDQAVARGRAVNFFALMEVWKKPNLVSELWTQLSDHVNLSVPFSPGIARQIGRLDADDSILMASWSSIAASMRDLRADDIILERGRPGYPAQLERSGDAPTFLFVRQQANVLETPAISIVGARKASDEGRLRARKLAHLLAKHGITVTSGLAAGIDYAAHSGALEAGGLTVAVLGTPLSRYYPREHQALQDRIGFVGAVISQFHPGLPTLPLCFPMRNSTMSGLSLGTVVIEASETSGALIQARRCLKQGRELFIPQSAVDNPSLRWPREYVSQGAHVFANIDDLTSVLERQGLIPRRELPPPRAVAIGENVS